MSRMARFLKEGVCYYIQSQGVDNQMVFKSDIDYGKFILMLKKYKIRFAVSIYGYCLMPQALHLVVHPKDANNLPLFMQGVIQSYALFFNGKYQRAGKVWAQRYKSALINDDSDLFECIRLIEYLPVIAKQSDSSVEYPWSSCSYRILGSGCIVDAMPPIGSIIASHC